MVNLICNREPHIKTAKLKPINFFKMLSEYNIPLKKYIINVEQKIIKIFQIYSITV